MQNLKNKVLTATLATVFLCGSLTMANAAQAAGIDSATQLTVSALLLTAFITAVVHTVTGPDHYLPFIAIAKSRNYGLKKNVILDFCLRHRPYCQCFVDSFVVCVFFALVDGNQV